MTATAHRSRLARSDLRVVSAGGTTAVFVAELAAEHAARKRRREKARWWRAIAAARCRKRRRSYGRLRAGVVAVLLCSITASVYLLNADTVMKPSTQAIGSSATASAGCPFIPLPDSVFGADLRPFKSSLNNFCDTVGNFASNLAEGIAKSIKDGIGSAFSPNRFCFGSRVALSPQDPNQGINSLMTRGVSFVFGLDKADDGKTTTWNQYGIAGASWNTYFLDCWTDGRNILNYAANFIFFFAKVLSLIAILLFQQTFNNQIVDYFFVPQNGAPESSIDTIIKQLNAGIYVDFFALAVVIGALVLLYNNVLRGQGSHSVVYSPGGIGTDGKRADSAGYIKAPSRNVRGSGLSDAIGKIGIMAAVAGFAALFVSYGSGYVQKANAYTNEVGAAVLGALAGTNCVDSGGVALAATPYDCAAQTMYDALVFRPWASGNIGELEVINNAPETKKRRELAMRMLKQNAYSMAESDEIANPATTPQRRQELFDAKQNDRTAMVKEWGAKFIAKDGQQAGDFDPMSSRPYSHVQATQEAYWRQWSGGESVQRIYVAAAAFIAAFTLGMVMFSISAAYLVLQLMTVLLAMAAPAFFLIGLIPGFGYQLLLRWAEIGMQLYVKRLALVCFIGALLAMLHLIFALALVWWMQLVLLIGVAAVGLAYRRQFTNWASLGMPGVGNAAGLATGGLSGALQARQSAKQMAKGWRSSRGLRTHERVGVAGRSGYAAFEQPYGTGGSEYPAEAHGVNSPPATQKPPPRTVPPPDQNFPVQNQYEPQGDRRRGAGVRYANARKTMPYASPASSRRSTGYVYRPGFAPDVDDYSTQQRERVNS